MANETFDNLVVNNTLGIGTPEPAAQLHISANAGISSKVFLESINGSLLKVTAEPNSASIGTENAFPLSINTNALPRIQISSDGNVGIGKPDPGAKLEVNGNLKLQQGVAVNKFSSDGNLTDSSDLSVPTEKAVKAYVSAQIAVVNQTLSTKAALAGASSQDFQTKNLTVSGNLATTGNVGIGTSTAPSAKLEVVGTVKATSFQGDGSTLDGLVRKTGDTMTGPLTIQNALTVSGNVGIGTTNPEGGLDINRGTVDAQVDASSDTLPLTAKADLVLTRRHSPTKSLNGYPASLIDFRATNAESSPNEWSVAQILGVVDLNVSGGYAGGLAFLTSPPGSNNPDGRRTRGAAPTARMVIDANGNVGIGTTAPAAKLDVEGNAMLGYEGNISNFGAPLKSGFYQNNGGQDFPGDIPDTSHAWTHLIVARHSNTQNNHQLQIASSYTNNDRLFFRKIQQGGLATDNPSWQEVATKAYVEQKINEIWSRFNSHVHRWGATPTTQPL